jgi:hypothetical protein
MGLMKVAAHCNARRPKSARPDETVAMRLWACAGRGPGRPAACGSGKARLPSAGALSQGSCNTSAQCKRVSGVESARAGSIRRHALSSCSLCRPRCSRIHARKPWLPSPGLSDRLRARQQAHPAPCGQHSRGPLRSKRPASPRRCKQLTKCVQSKMSLGDNGPSRGRHCRHTAHAHLPPLRDRDAHGRLGAEVRQRRHSAQSAGHGRGRDDGPDSGGAAVRARPHGH